MSGPPPEPAEATVRTHGRFSLIWLVPLVAAALAIYLGWTTLASRGPLISITFANGSGLTAGQTRLEHNSVAIGTVQSVGLTADFKQVVAKVRVTKNAAPLLTSHTRFWIVRPRLSLTDLSGLQTLVSGSYLAVDPGLPGGEPQLQFRGLDQPPGVRSDQPGETFTLQSPRLGWLATGAPVFYHDIEVGRLTDFTDPGMGQPLTLHVFVKAPYDEYVRSATHFWNTSGLTATFGPNGVHVAVESVEALLAGGINFDNFEDADKSPPPGPNTTFHLFENFDNAQNAGFRDNIHYVAYFGQSVAGLEPGSAVKLFGIRVGTVTATQLQLDPNTAQPRVRVTFDVQPARVFTPEQIPKVDPVQETQKFVGLGMRARVDTGNLLTGQEIIGLDLSDDAPAGEVRTEGGLIVWPSQNGGLEDMTNSVREILTRLKHMPLDKLGDHADELLTSLQALSATADNDLKPVATELPELSRHLQATLQKADQLLGSLKAGYGANSDTHDNLQQLATEAAQAVRAVRELTTYLDGHPGSVVWGRR